MVNIYSKLLITGIQIVQGTWPLLPLLNQHCWKKKDMNKHINIVYKFFKSTYVNVAFLFKL